MTDDDTRPSPEALLREAAREGRGRLKIFLGAAPGVGKTYEMLREGAERQAAGIDVVVGIVETHGRRETEALVAPLEVIPRRMIPYRGQSLTEMDLDALLARHPDLALVDELAHTNAPGSRHPKRWQDIEELLAAGIDVTTTVNVQHLESLNDIVGSFTHVRVRETVPDRVFEDADIKVVDLPPDDLIQRLKERKVYLPEEAGRALDHFFTRTNLSALRELALRRAAQAVDQQMLEQLRLGAVPGAWAAGERILVAVSEDSGSRTLIRAAKRLADALRGTLTAVHVETMREQRFDEAQRRALGETLGLASELGATLMSVSGGSVKAALTAQIREMRATQLVIGKSRRSRLFELRHGSVVHDLLETTESVAIHVIPMEAERLPRRGWRRSRTSESPGGYFASLAMVAATILLAKAVEPWVGYGATDLFFIVPVIAAATFYGGGPSFLAALASGLVFNFFFLPPTGTFTIYDPRNVITVIVLVAVGLVTSQLAARVRVSAAMSARSARENAALARFAGELGRLSTPAEMARAVASGIGGLLGAEALVVGRDEDNLEVLAASPAATALGATERAAAEWALDRGEPAGMGTGTLTGSEWQFRPLNSPGGTLAVLALRRPGGGHPVPAERSALAASLVDQAGLAYERLRLQAEASELRATRARDDLRSTLLTSLGHDLRTPLTAVTVAAEALDPSGQDAELVATIRSEAGRLAKFMGDLLDVTRIEEGAVRVALEPVDLTDIVAGVLSDLRRPLEGRDVVVDVDPDLPLVRADPVLLQHALLNLVDNALKYSPPDQPIEIRARERGTRIVLGVRDRGPGIAPGAERSIFDRFIRGQGSDRNGGTGLGLAIVKGFATAMGLEVRAANVHEGGARFSIVFPSDAVIPVDAEAGR